MSENDLIRVGEPMPRLASVRAAGEALAVVVTWASGSRVGREDRVDLAPMILSYKVLRPLRDDARRFHTVRLGEDGASIIWDGSADWEIGADSLEDMAEEAMSSLDFSSFLERNGLTFESAAAVLGLSRRMIAYYAKDRAVPRTVALACRYLDLTRDSA